MKTFMAVYIGSASAAEKAGWDDGDSAARQERQIAGVNAWGEWATAFGGAIVDRGTPLGRTLRVSPAGVEPITNASTGYVIVRAETHEAAAAMFLDHPHFTLLPGDSVEVMECLPLPGASRG